jgi:hypothetical protein
MESDGQDGTAFGDREVLLCGYPPWVLGVKSVCFQWVGGMVYRKVLVFRNLEAKLLKTENLC